MQPQTQYPVSASYHGEAGWQSPGLAYDDYTRMRTRPAKGTGRHAETPAWVHNNVEVRETIVLFMECRALLVRCGKGIFAATLRNAREGTLSERLDRAHAALLERRQRSLVEQIKKLCIRYKTEPVEKRQVLAELIENADTQLRIIERGAGLPLAVLHFYYNLGMDSVEIGQELQIKPPHVRQILHRLHQTHEVIAGIRSGRVHVIPFVPKLTREGLDAEGRTVPLCLECGQPCKKKVCNRSCAAKKQHKINKARIINAKAAETLKFCSPTCHETFRLHPLDALKRLGIDIDAVRKEHGESYTTYVLYCAQLNQAPMPAAQWEMLRNGPSLGYGR